MIKVNDLWGDLTDVSTKTKTWTVTYETYDTCDALPLNGTSLASIVCINPPHIGKFI